MLAKEMTVLVQHPDGIHPLSCRFYTVSDHKMVIIFVM